MKSSSVLVGVFMMMTSLAYADDMLLVCDASGGSKVQVTAMSLGSDQVLRINPTNKGPMLGQMMVEAAIAEAFAAGDLSALIGQKITGLGGGSLEIKQSGENISGSGIYKLQMVTEANEYFDSQLVSLNNCVQTSLSKATLR